MVPGSQTYVPIKIALYRKQSDPGPYPVPPEAPIEGEKPDGGRLAATVM